MVIFVKPNGSTVVENDVIALGTTAGKIAIVAQSRPGAFVEVMFSPPSGVSIPPVYAAPMMSVDAEDLGIYLCDISHGVASVSGKVRYQISFTMSGGGKELTPEGTFTVQPGVVSLPPENPTQSMYEEIRNAMIAASANYTDVVAKLNKALSSAEMLEINLAEIDAAKKEALQAESNAKSSETSASTSATSAAESASKAKTEADRAKSEADRAMESDPTVPAWAKKPNPPTPAEIGAIAMFTTSKRLELPGWYRVGTLSMGVLHTAAVRLIIGGQFNHSAHRTQIVDISVDYVEGYITKAVDTVNASNVTKVRLYRLNATDVAIDIYYATTGGNNVRVYVEQLFGSFATGPLDDVTSLSGTILAELDLNECANPPMQLGVEYRTTERWMRKPVYVKGVSLGFVPAANSKSIAHGSTNVESVITYGGYMGANSLPFEESIGGNKCYLGANRTDITITTTYDWSATQTAYAWFKYTKTTD